jgi:DNA polymerase III subunit delta'
VIFPWQIKQQQQLWRAKQEGRLPHALLFTGIAGTGKAQFADGFTHTLLCQQVTASGDYCNQCHACRLIAGRVHPNVLWIEPEKEGQVIKVDLIRGVSEFINNSSLQGEYRIVVIYPANAMNTNAANALLKTLEEPSSGSLIILISAQSEQLPATILSRCQRISFPQPKKEEALLWLKNQLKNKLNNKLPDNTFDPELLLNLAQGSPFAALRLVEDEILPVRHDLFQAFYQLSQKPLSQTQSDPIKTAAALQNINPLLLIDFSLNWIMDLLRLQLGEHVEEIMNRDYGKQLAELQQRTHLKKNTDFLEYLQQLRGQICAGINLNKPLLIEGILLRWMENVRI